MMINREDVVRYLVNHYGCERGHGVDSTLIRRGNGQVFHATFGNHTRHEVSPGMVTRFLQDLGFDRNGQDFRDICDHFNIRR